MSDSREQILLDCLVTAKSFIAGVRNLSDQMPERLVEEVDLFEAEIKLFEARRKFLAVLEAE